MVETALFRRSSDRLDHNSLQKAFNPTMATPGGVFYFGVIFYEPVAIS
jgi:hypothetical protein